MIKMISDSFRERYNIPQMLALPIFFLDCKFDEQDEEEKRAFNASFENILISARIKMPYNPQGATASPAFRAK
jgi:hypothetical protein